MKASFFERFIAYGIDIIIISSVIALIATFIPSVETTKLKEQLLEITENYVAGDFNVSKYASDVSAIQYEIDTKTMLITIISVFISMMYFMYFQFRNKGKTIGKHMMKIKIIKRTGNLELNDLVIRSLLINGILSSMIVLIIIFVTNENNYFVARSSIEMIQSTFILIASIMVLFRKDKRGLHDIICDTNVISYRNEEKVV